MTRSLITWFFVGWFSLIFIVSRFQSILKFNVLYDFAILRMKLGVKGLINVPLLRNCFIVRSTIGWFDIVIVRLGDSVHFGFFPRTFSSRCYSPSEGFSPPGYFSWKLSPFGVITLGFSEIFSFRCLFSSSRFSSFFTFMLGSTRAVLAIIFQWFGFFFRPDFFGCFDVVFLPSRSGLDPCGPDLFSSTFDPSFRMFRRRILGFYLGCFGHRFHNCMAIHLFWCTAVSDVFVGEYFARSRSFFFFCLCSDYLRHSVHNRMDFLSHFWRLGIFQRLSLAFDYFSAVLRLVPARPKSWLLSPCGSRSYSANFDPSFLMLRRGHKRLAAVVWQRGPLLFFRLFGGFWLFTTGGVPLKYTVNGRQASDLRSGAPRWSLRLHHTASLDSGSLYWISCDQLLYYDY